MKPGRISEWYKKANRREVDLRLPKFKFEESYDLKEMLIKLGVTDMFGLSADFSGINGELYTVYFVYLSRLICLVISYNAHVLIVHRDGICMANICFYNSLPGTGIKHGTYTHIRIKMG